MFMNQGLNQQEPHQKPKKKPSQNSTFILPPNKVTNQPLKIKKTDLRLFQQYCDLSELGVLDKSGQQSTKHGKIPPGGKHQKYKSVGSTPVNRSPNGTHFKQQQYKGTVTSQKDNQSAMNPVLDYQKYLNSDQVMHGYQKPKSSLGFYSQLHNPGHYYPKKIPHSKSPERVAVPQFQNHLDVTYQPSNKSLANQSALSNYQNAPLVTPQALNEGIMRAPQASRSNSRMQQRSSKSPNPSIQQPSAHQPDKLKQISVSNKQQNNVKDYIQPLHNRFHNLASPTMQEDSVQLSKQQYSAPKHKKYYSQQLNEDNLIDSNSVYDQFIQGPHNISQNSYKYEDAQNLQIVPKRPQTQLQNMTQKQKFIRKGPPLLGQGGYTRSGIQKNQKSQKTGPISVQNTLNNSCNKRMLMGRTPSPNFFQKAIAVTPTNNEYAYYKHLQKQGNLTNKNIFKTHISLGYPTKRSQSKQQYSSASNHRSGKNNVGQGFIQGSRKPKKKQKFIPQNGPIQYKEGCIATSYNTAHNSPNRSVTPSNRQNSKKSMSNQPSLGNLYEQPKKQSSGQPFHQQQLKAINEQEEKKALAMISSIGSIHKNMQEPHAAHQLSQFAQHHGQQQNFQRPAQLKGELLEGEPQALSTNEFMKTTESRPSSKQRPHIIRQHSSNSLTNKSLKSNQNSMIQQIMDGGTGANGIVTSMLQSQNSSLAGATIQDIPRPQTSFQHFPNYPSSTQNQKHVQQYLDQLQGMRQVMEQSVQSKGSIKSPQVQDNTKQLSQLIKNQPAMTAGVLNTGDAQRRMSKESKVKTSQEYSLHGLGQRRPSKEDVHQNPTNLSSQSKRQKNTLVEPPKIQAPSLDMFQAHHRDLNNQSHPGYDYNVQTTKFQPSNIGVIVKTPFERELEQKAQELSHLRNYQSTKPKDNSLAILKQLQQSEVFNVHSKSFYKQDKSEMSKPSVHKVSSNTHAYQVQQDRDNDSQNVEDFSQDDEPNYPSARTEDMIQQREGHKSDQHLSHNQQLPSNSQTSKQRQINDGASERQNSSCENYQVLITQEEEEQIKGVASDINEKAFYGKFLKNKKLLDIESNFSKLSPRSREIASVMSIIQKSFGQNEQPPVTTTDFYRIGKMLGRGAFGKVNLAMHKLVRRLVAMKSLNKECLTDEAQKAKLMKEVSLLLKQRHNHVVKIYETIETEKHIIIVMELCAGGDLLNYVRKRRRLKEPYAKVIFKQIIDGLCYIHSKCIAHRDIKLDNILLDGKGSVKIADFGVSKQSQKGQKMTEQCGTPAYIAPEILKDKGYHFNVDIWSAGVVLFAMLYGTVPFKANNMEELHKLIIKGKYTLKDDISAEARNLLRGLLEVNPEKRLSINQIYKHKWLQDVDPDLQLFNDQERGMIKKEYTYNDPKRYNRNENEEPVDCFTEHNLESVYNSLKNASTKSVILAPFNSTQSHLDEDMQKNINELLCEKMMVLKIARRCREIDRQYEFNNNGDLDNGVYHKYIQNTEEDEGDGEDQKEQNDDQLNEPMLLSSKPSYKKGGKGSIENSFNNDNSISSMQQRQEIAKQLQDSSSLHNEMQRNRKRKDLDLDDEMVKTYETFQSNRASGIDEENVNKLVQFGYPRDHVIHSLNESEPNYCSAGYYLLGMDQNYC